MSYLGKKILKHKGMSGFFGLALVFVAGGWIWAYAALHNVTGPLILHFNNFAGITQVGNIWDLFGVAILGIVIVKLNWLIAMELEERAPYLGKLMLAATLVISLLLFIGFAAIINVN